MTNFNFLFRNSGHGESHLNSTCLRDASEMPPYCLRQLLRNMLILCVLQITLGMGEVLEAPSNDDLSALLGKLTAFQICLITNVYHGTFAPDTSLSSDTKKDNTTQQ